MTQDWKVRYCRSRFAALRVIGGAIAPSLLTLILPSFSAQAQITPDNSLGSERSQVAPSSNIRGLPGILIRGGATRGRNLFQSFSEFNVGEGQRVYFANPAGIESILSRVTGKNPSNILGTLGVNGAANLFLINPNGILFGANSRLDIAGSFVATTAASLTFENGLKFSATNPEAPPLLTVTLRPGLQYGTQYQGNITNAGTLAVGAGQTLSLQGNGVTHTGSLTAPGGTVQVLGNQVALLEAARISVSGTGGGGTVLVGGDFQGKGAVPTATQAIVGKDVTISADALDTGNGGNVVVWANGSTQFNGKISARGGSNGGDGGNVEVSGKQTLNFNGYVDTTAAKGAIGNLLLDPYDFEVNASNVSNINNSPTTFTITADNNITFNAPIAITTFRSGLTANAGNSIFVNQNITTNGGDIKLQATNGDITLNGVKINTGGVTAFTGLAGSVSISAGKQVTIDNSTLDARSDFAASSNSGFTTIQISGASVLINQAYISTTNNGDGFAGDIAITARDQLTISNSRGTRTSSSGVVTYNAPGIFSQGNFGRILIGQSDYFSYSPKTVILDNAQLITNNNNSTSSSPFNAGNIEIRATEGIALSNGSIVSSSSNRQGNAGNVILQGGLVSLSDASEIRTEAYAAAQGNAGSVEITAENLNVIGKSSISTSTYTNSSSYNSNSLSGALTSLNGSSAGAVLLLIGNEARLDDGNIFNNLENGASGQAGLVLLTANSLSLLNGAQIQTLVRGKDENGPAANGSAGNILIGVDKTIKVIGQNSEGFPSAIFSSVEAGASGNSGTVLIAGRNQDRATSVQLRDGGTINVRNASQSSSDQAGDVFILARGVWLDKNSTIVAVSQSGQGGNILLDIDALILGRSSSIQATAGILGTEGSGGNIAIGTGTVRPTPVFRKDGSRVVVSAFDGRTLLIAGKTDRDNNILAEAYRGTGGNIQINAFRLQDIADRPNLITRNDISTASFLGNSGTTVVSTLNIFPSFRSDPLPERYEVPKVAEGCDPRDRQETSKFIITGRGGVPTNPTEVLNQETIAGINAQNPAVSVAPAANPDGDEIVPARGWVRDASGKIWLTAYATDPTVPIAPNPLWLAPAPCHAP